jgi:hypothetical protein
MENVPRQVRKHWGILDPDLSNFAVFLFLFFVGSGQVNVITNSSFCTLPKKRCGGGGGGRNAPEHSAQNFNDFHQVIESIT